MSHYITRWCQKHGDWDDDVDNPEESCPACIKDGTFRTRKQLEAEIERLRERVAELEENHRMQLAAISVAATSNTRESAKNGIHRGNPYWTVAYGDVVYAVSREIKERERAEQAEAELKRLKEGK